MLVECVPPAPAPPTTRKENEWMDGWMEGREEEREVPFYPRWVTQRMYVLSFLTCLGHQFKITPHILRVPPLQWIPSPQRHIRKVVLTLSLGGGRWWLYSAEEKNWDERWDIAKRHCWVVAELGPGIHPFPTYFWFPDRYRLWLAGCWEVSILFSPVEWELGFQVSLTSNLLRKRLECCK